MTVEIWLAIITTLITIIGTLAGVGYRDFAKRMNKLEKQDTKLFNAVLTLLIVKPDDHVAIANALHGLLTNGVQHD